ncbi:catalase A-like [Brevipalpus obovatus]|uniref:catalase A-like n=1 Tax=Brevipalpus obovatus TaxID=246614 RepID=UPI003D9EFE26
MFQVLLNKYHQFFYQFWYYSIFIGLTYHYTNAHVVDQEIPSNQSIAEVKFPDDSVWISDKVDQQTMNGAIFMGAKHYTTLAGKDVDDPEHTLTSGYEVLMEDNLYRKRIGAFNRERIPERIVHARGTSAFGFFLCTGLYLRDIVDLEPFRKFGQITKIAARFSTSSGDHGSPDLQMDIRGFAVKFYTKEGIWDLLMLSYPIFFIRDPIKFADLTHSQRKDPKNNIFSYDRFWEFVAKNPETMNAYLRQFSAAGTTLGFQFFNAFAINTFICRNRWGERSYCRFAAIVPVTVGQFSESVDLLGTDPDFSTRDLYNAIRAGRYPIWEFRMRVLSVSDAANLTFSPYDATVDWPDNIAPPIRLGFLIYTKNPKNAFTDTEQLAFNPASLIPNIYPSPDPLLHGRLFAYQDAQIYRLGTNPTLLKRNNNPYAFQPNRRDGKYQCGSNYGHLPDYYPNSKLKLEVDEDIQFQLEGSNLITRYNSDFDDNFWNAGDFWRNTAPENKVLILHNLSRHLSQANFRLQKKILKILLKIDHDLFNLVLTELIAYDTVDLFFPRNETISETYERIKSDISRKNSILTEIRQNLGNLNTISPEILNISVASRNDLNQ